MTLIERDHVPSEASLPTPYGEFVIRVFHEEETGLDHVAMTLGSMDGPDPVLVRLHSECLTGDVFGSPRTSLRLRAATPRRTRAHLDSGMGCRAVPPPGGSGHRIAREDPSVSCVPRGGDEDSIMWR